MMNIDEYLMDPGCHPPKEVEKYLNGDCEIFAIAVKRLFNYPIYAILEQRTITPSLIIGDGLIHAFNVPDNNTTLIVDAKGYRESNELNEEYLVHPDCWITHLTEDELIHLVYQSAAVTSMCSIEAAIDNAISFINKHYLKILT